MKKNKYEIKKKVIVTISMFMLVLSMGLYSYDAYGNGAFELNYEYINIKDLAQTNVSSKVNNTSILKNFLNIGNTNDIALDNKKLKEVDMPNVRPKNDTPKQFWRLPTEIGVISQYPSYRHMAYDITSPRGTSENIFPVANGVVSSIYTDSYGAKIVTILHNVDGKRYTSQYVHLSAYESSLYVGKEVTVNDSIGRMGTTGYSTGVHLHLAVLDCALYAGDDPNCYDLNGFFRYGKKRINEGYYGLGSLMNMPSNWNTR